MGVELLISRGHTYADVMRYSLTQFYAFVLLAIRREQQQQQDGAIAIRLAVWADKDDFNRAVTYGR